MATAASAAPAEPAASAAAPVDASIIVLYKSFDLRVHDHTPLSHAMGFTQAYLEAHPAERPAQSAHDVHGPHGRNAKEDARLTLPSAHAHVLPVYVFDTERWFHRLTLSSVLLGPTGAACDAAKGHPPTRPLADDASDITDSRIPHPSEEPPRRLEGEELKEASFGYDESSATAQSKYLSPMSVLRETTIMKTDIKRAAFLLECVADLQQSLRALGSDLIVRVGRTEDVVAELIKESNAVALYMHADYAQEEFDVSACVANKCAEANVALRNFEGNTLYSHADLPFTLDKVPDVFTPFRSKVEALGPQAVRSTRAYSVSLPPERLAEPAAAEDERRARVLVGDALPEFVVKPVPPAMASAQKKLPDMPTLQQLGFTEKALQRFRDASPHRNSSFPFTGGETSALEHLNRYLWVTNDVSHYRDTRNALNGVSYSSKFSPFLSAGCLSPRRIYEAMQKYEREVTKNTSTTWLVVELLFRDHFRFLADKYGRKIFFKYGPNAHSWIRQHKSEVEWRTDVRLLRAWCLGLTGFPFIDACMRELLHTGYMSNRGRQVVASFLLHDLKIDWRLGAAWFESQLIDHDIPSNYGNWTYQAGVAFDPRSPYRYFNIHKQAQMYDPTASHVKLWLPELGDQTGRGERGQHAAASSSYSSHAYPKPIMQLQSEVQGGHAGGGGGGGGKRNAEAKEQDAAAAEGARSQQRGAREKRPTPGANGASDEAAGSPPPPRQQQQRQPGSRRDQQRRQHDHEPQQGRGGSGRNHGHGSGGARNGGARQGANSGDGAHSSGSHGHRSHHAQQHRGGHRGAQVHDGGAHVQRNQGSHAAGASSSSSSSADHPQHASAAPAHGDGSSASASSSAQPSAAAPFSAVNELRQAQAARLPPANQRVRIL